MQEKYLFFPYIVHIISQISYVNLHCINYYKIMMSLRFVSLQNDFYGIKNIINKNIIIIGDADDKSSRDQARNILVVERSERCA